MKTAERFPEFLPQLFEDLGGILDPLGMDERARDGWKAMKLLLDSPRVRARCLAIDSMNYAPLKVFKEWHSNGKAPVGVLVNKLRQSAKWAESAPIPGTVKVVSDFASDGEPIFASTFLLSAENAESVCGAWNEAEKLKGSRSRFNRYPHKGSPGRFFVKRRTPLGSNKSDGTAYDSVIGFDRQGGPVFGAKRGGGQFSKQDAEDLCDILNDKERAKGSRFNFSPVHLAGMPPDVWKIQIAEYDYLAHVSMDAFEFEASNLTEFADSTADGWSSWTPENSSALDQLSEKLRFGFSFT